MKDLSYTLMSSKHHEKTSPGSTNAAAVCQLQLCTAGKGKHLLISD